MWFLQAKDVLASFNPLPSPRGGLRCGESVIEKIMLNFCLFLPKITAQNDSFLAFVQKFRKSELTGFEVGLP